MNEVNPNLYQDEGITPWGSRFIAFFKDKDGMPCTKESAYEVHIHEQDADGNWIRETVAFLTSKCRPAGDP